MLPIPPLPLTKGSANLPPCKDLNKYKHLLHIKRIGKTTGSHIEREYLSWKKITGQSPNVIYLIQYKICQKQYVGWTKSLLRDQISVISGQS